MAELSLPFDTKYCPVKRLFNMQRRALEEPEEETLVAEVTKSYQELLKVKEALE